MAKENKAGRGANIVRREKFWLQNAAKDQRLHQLLKLSGCLGRARWVVGDALNFSVPRKKSNFSVPRVKIAADEGEAAF